MLQGRPSSAADAKAAMDTQTTRMTMPGTAPGSLTGRIIEGEETLHFTLVEYDQKKCDVFYEVPIDECRFHLASPEKTWIDVSGRPSADMPAAAQCSV